MKKLAFRIGLISTIYSIIILVYFFMPKIKYSNFLTPFFGITGVLCLFILLPFSIGISIVELKKENFSIKDKSVILLILMLLIALLSFGGIIYKAISKMDM